MKKMMKKSGVLGLVLLLIISLTACGGPKETPSSVTALYLDALIKQEYDALNNYTGLDETSADFLDGFEEGFTSELGSNIDAEDIAAVSDAMLQALSIVTYEIIDETIDGKVATVELDIYGLDFQKIMTDMIADLMPLAMSGEIAADQIEAETVKLMVKHLSAAQKVTTPSHVVITLTKENGKWILSESEINTLLLSGVMDMSGMGL